jgi:predicted AAA+ superfamily ATPase
LKTKNSFQYLTLEEIISNKQEISSSICEKINPLNYFSDYLHHGFYPFFLEKRNFSENLLKTMNMMLEVDILIIRQIEPKYLGKIRKLLYLLSVESPIAPNVSQLSLEIDTSRATVMNYLKYLEDARLLNLLYAENEEFPKKPKSVFMQNSNLLHVVNPYHVNTETECKTFLYNSLRDKHKVNAGKHNADFLVNEQYAFKFSEKLSTKTNKNYYSVVNEENTINKKAIPLWLFGFLY